MKLGLIILMAALSCEGTVLTRCQLAKQIIKTKLIKKTFIPSYVCLAEKVSNRDTSLVSGSGNKKAYGLYQIPQKWCKEKKPGGDCNIACESLLDDNLTDDTECAQFIVYKEGFKYWQLYDTRCKDKLKFYAEEIYKCPDVSGRSTSAESDEETIESEEDSITLH